MFYKVKMVYFVVYKFWDSGLCQHSTPSPFVQNSKKLGQFCEPLYILLVKRINQENKIYLGPNDVLHHLGPHYSVAIMGLWWPGLACVGCCGPLLADMVDINM